MAGMFGGPLTGVEPGSGPCISTVTPCGMLAIRTIVGLFLGGLAPGHPVTKSPGSICNAWPAVCEYPVAVDGFGSASLTCCR